MTIAKNTRAWQSALFDALLFGVIFGLTNVISYGFIVMTGRSLKPADYGTFSALLGLISLGGVFANSIQAGATQAVKTSTNTLKLHHVLSSAWKYSALGAAVLIAVLLPFKQQLNANTSQVILGGLCLFAMIMSSAVVGYLAGIGKVRAQADLACYGAIARLATGWLLLTTGFGISGALGGYVINYLFIFVLAIIYNRSYTPQNNTKIASKTKNIKIETSTLLIFMLTYATFTLDQFAVQFFNPSVGGDYAAAATIAKLTFFTAFPVIAIAYPRMLTQTSRLAQLKTLRHAATAIVASGTALVIVLLIFPHEITTLFFGNQFEMAAANIPILALGVLFFSMSVLAMHAKIAWRYTAGYIPAAVLLGGGFLLHAYRHQDIGKIVENQTIIFGTQMLFLWASFILNFNSASISLHNANDS
ncbi:hypothetical protein LNV09_05730 [Paucibacter sp. B2R-40]|uniref:hypothetical protein n=1 Tax=Paucibacter sp. B2R-40 TaxID=2893554 RepID=UPI0021E44E42|nr:hypothetical protein [Paucibacter sp. B2R-40]MCV2353660.1 hypothetical protein [Paucibacter sp. B2R-40]